MHSSRGIIYANIGKDAEIYGHIDAHLYNYTSGNVLQTLFYTCFAHYVVEGVLYKYTDRPHLFHSCIVFHCVDVL